MRQQSSNSWRSSHGQSHLNLVPFIDVLLILVVLLMTSVSTLQQSIIVDLPKVSGDAVESKLTKEPLMISLTEDNKMYLEHSLTPRVQLDPQMIYLRLKALKMQNVADTLFVVADKNCQYNNVMEMISLVNKAGFTQVTLVTDKESS